MGSGGRRFPRFLLRLCGGFGSQHSKPIGRSIDHRSVARGQCRPQLEARHQMLDQFNEELLGQDLGMQHNELADGAVVGLMAAAQPPRADIAARQHLQLAQRPLAVENPVDNKP